MATIWSQLGKEQERRRRERRRQEEWLRKETVAVERRAERDLAGASKAAQAEAVRQEHADGRAEAGRRNVVIEQELAELADLLQAVLAMPPRSLAWLRADLDVPPFEPPQDIDEPRPAWSDFAPSEPGVFGRRRYERDLAAAQKAFQEAGWRREHQMVAAVEAARRAHDAAVERIRHEHEHWWRAMAESVSQRDPEAVKELVGLVLERTEPVARLLRGGRALYRADPKEIVIELDLPEAEVIPSARTWKYVQTRRVVELATSRPQREIATLYDELLSRLVLGVMLATFRSIAADLVDLVTINGQVPTDDPATGQPVARCLITVTANRASFDELVLDSARLNPAQCLDFLGADRSKHPMALAPVEPFVDFDAAQYRLDVAAESIAVADGEVLLEMDPYDFEGLVRDLFEAMGYRAWRTQPSHDDGIDAVAVTDHRFTPVECVIQVKRVRRAVPPHYVQALMGAMAEHGTATHGVLVTTSWLSDRSRQRARAQRIQIIDGAELPALIQQYLGRRVVVARDDGTE